MQPCVVGKVCEWNTPKGVHADEGGGASRDALLYGEELARSHQVSEPATVRKVGQAAQQVGAVWRSLVDAA